MAIRAKFYPLVLTSLSITDPARDQPVLLLLLLLLQMQAKEPASFPIMPCSLSAQQIELLYQNSSSGTCGLSLILCRMSRVGTSVLGTCLLNSSFYSSALTPQTRRLQIKCESCPRKVLGRMYVRQWPAVLPAIWRSVTLVLTRTDRVGLTLKPQRTSDAFWWPPS